jgi:hypothetical protein
METPIPITIELSYDTYCLHYSQGLLAGYLHETICPKYPHDCTCKDPPTALELTGTSVERTAFFLERDQYGIDTVVERKVKIVLAKCRVCNCRVRLLPADILPYKRYSLPVIEQAVSLYNRGDLSLRQVAWDQLYGECTPAHTTVHGWTEGLGAYLLGRPVGQAAFSIPAARILAELETRFAQVTSLDSISVWINPEHYRSQGRLERLQACKRFEIIGTIIDGHNAWNLCGLNRLTVGWGNSFALGFRTGICSTAIEHLDSMHVRLWRQSAKKEPLSCPIHGRSPPGDLK